MSKDDQKSRYIFHPFFFFTMHNVKYAAGLDIAKDKFQVCFSVLNAVQKVTVKASSHFANTATSFGLLLKWVHKHSKENLPIVFIMEATDVYHEQLAWYLHGQGCQVSVVLSTKAKRYFQSLGLKSKNDKIDAQGLAQMGCEQCLTLWQPISKNLYQLRGLTRLQESLQEQKTVLINQLEAFSHQMYQSKLYVSLLLITSLMISQMASWSVIRAFLISGGICI